MMSPLHHLIQMGKQTMGTPVQSFPYRMDHKMYRLQTPQAPVVRTSTYDFYGIDDYPLGTNAVVAVISYTVSRVCVCVCVRVCVCVCLSVCVCVCVCVCLLVVA